MVEVNWRGLEVEEECLAPGSDQRVGNLALSGQRLVALPSLVQRYPQMT